MKRLFNFMAVLVAVSALAASCAKPELESTENGSVNSGLYDGPVKTLTFEAVIGETPTKTTLGNPVTGADGTVKVPVLWENGDKVDVHWKNGEESASATGEIVVDEQTGKANFSVKIPESLSDETVFYAVYPSGTTASLSPESGEIQITIPTVTGSFKKANIMVARCSNAKQAPAFSFKHACGIIRFETGAHAFKDGKKVSRVSLYGGHREYIRGNVSLGFTDDNTVSVTANSAQKNRYSSAEDITTNSECYVAVYPDYEFANGIIVNFYNEQLSVFSEKAFTISRGQILNLGNVEARINDHRDFYFKPTGTGTGDATSWENAGDIAKFRELLTEVESEGAAYGQRLKLDNTNYHFMEGEYQLAEGGVGAKRFDLKYTIAPRELSTPLNFYGGYSAADPSVKDPQRYETIFTGKDQYAILAVRDRVILNLDGIVFEKAYAKNAFDADGLLGAALYVARSVNANKMPEVHVNNCVFRDNQESDIELNANNGGGSAINLRAGKVYVNNCLFKDNTAYNRGCLIASKSAIEGSVLFINACRFTGNAIITNYGSVIRCEHQGVKLGINGCSFGQNDCGDECNSPVTICSPFVFTNNTLIEDASRFKSTSSVGILRMNYGEASTGGVCANNIVLDCSQGQADEDMSVYYAGKFAVTMKYMANLMGGHKQSNSTYHTNVDLLGGDSYTASSKTGLHPSNFESLSYNTAANYWTWTGNIVGVDNLTFQKVSAENMIMATRAQETVGDDFYNWLVKIGAIVDGKFTDCRGYIRPTDAMCPGSYDPNAQPTL